MSSFVRQAWERARLAYPGVIVGLDELEAFAAARDEATELESLYLTCACARGDATAIRLFEQRYFAQIDAAVARFGDSRTAADEVRQRVREKLFTGTAPRIAEYGGRGDLGRWLKAIALRIAIDLLRSGRREIATASPEALAERVLGHHDAELDAIKRRYTADFNAAIRRAIEELAVEQRNDLRLYYIDGVKLEHLATLHGVSIASASRRLARARGDVLDATRRILRESLGIADDDVQSLLRIIESRLDLGRSALRE